ncbi:MAG: S1C family serine protease [Bacteroidota bacterium]
MEDIIVMEAVEKYINGKMSNEERSHFEKLRTEKPEIDQLVVSHALFLQGLKHYGNVRALKHALHEVHNQLSHEKRITPIELTHSAKVINFWKRYKRTITIAASIAGITAICINVMAILIAPETSSKQVQELVRSVDAIKTKQYQQDKRINNIVNATKLPSDKSITGIGSAFMIDSKGLLVTNAHVVRNAKGIIVTNYDGAEFTAKILSVDAARDIAFLMIDDKEFKSPKIIPYGFRKQGAEMAEPIFTLGYPDNKFVYGEGYMSSLTGHDGDTLNCQIAVAANPGNSGGPVFNRYGEIIGILSTREIQSEGVVYAVQSKYIQQSLQDLKRSNEDLSSIKINFDTKVRGMDKVQQVKRFRDFVYMLKVY